MLSHRAKGLMLGIGAGFLMSFFPIFFRELGQVASIKVALFTMFLMSLVFSFPIVWISNSQWYVARRGLCWIFLVALCALIGNAAYNIGLRWIDPAVAVSVQRSELIMVAIFGAVLFKEYFDSKIYIAIILSLIGLWILQDAKTSIRDTHFLGIVMMLCSALGFALMLVFSKFALRYTSAAIINIYRLLMVLLVLMFIPDIFSELAMAPISAWGFGLLCALFGPLGARLMITLALNSLPMAHIMLMSLIAPALTAIWQWFFYGMGLGITEVLGASLVVAGAGIVMLKNKPTKSVDTSTDV